MSTIGRRRSEPLAPGLIRLGLMAAFGAVGASAAIVASRLEPRYAAAAIVLAALLGLSPLLGSIARARAAAIAALSLGLSLNASISFLNRTEIPGSHVIWVGGAAAVTVSLSFLGALGYVALRGWEAWALARPGAGVRAHSLIVCSLVLFMTCGALSLVNALDAPIAILELLRLLTLLFITVTVMNFTGAEQRWFVAVLAASVVIQAGIAGLQFATGRDLGLAVFGEQALISEAVDYQEVLRPTGTIGNPNILAYFFEITLPVVLGVALATRGPALRLLAWAASAAAITGALVTLSRAAWLTIPFSVAVMAIAVGGRRLLRGRTILAGCGLVVVGLLGLLRAWPLLAERLLGDDAGSASHRVPLNEAAWSVLKQFPVLGVGLNNFAISFNRYDATGYSRLFSDEDEVVHNLFLLTWTEVGTVGFVAFLWCFGAVFVTVWRIGRGPASRLARAVALGIAVGFAAHLFHGLFDPGFRLSLAVSQLVAALTGLAGAIALDQSGEAGTIRERRGAIAKPPALRSPVTTV